MCQMCIKYQKYYLGGPEILCLQLKCYDKQLELSNYLKIVEHFLHLSWFDLTSQQNN